MFHKPFFSDESEILKNCPQIRKRHKHFLGAGLGVRTNLQGDTAGEHRMQGIKKRDGNVTQRHHTGEIRYQEPF